MHAKTAASKYQQNRMLFITSSVTSTLYDVTFCVINDFNAILRHQLRQRYMTSLITSLYLPILRHVLPFCFFMEEKNEISESFCKKNNFIKLSESKALKMKCFSLIVPL